MTPERYSQYIVITNILNSVSSKPYPQSCSIVSLDFKALYKYCYYYFFKQHYNKEQNISEATGNSMKTIFSFCIASKLFPANTCKSALKYFVVIEMDNKMAKFDKVEHSKPNC